MKQTFQRVVGVAAATSIALLVVAGCSNDDSSDSAASSSTVSMAESATTSGSAAAVAPVELTAADGSTVRLTGPIAAKYAAATEKQPQSLDLR